MGDSTDKEEGVRNEVVCAGKGGVRAAHKGRGTAVRGVEHAEHGGPPSSGRPWGSRLAVKLRPVLCPGEVRKQVREAENPRRDKDRSERKGETWSEEREES